LLDRFGIGLHASAAKLWYDRDAISDVFRERPTNGLYDGRAGELSLKSYGVFAKRQWR
jgi:hypothetical protein